MNQKEKSLLDCLNFKEVSVDINLNQMAEQMKMARNEIKATKLRKKKLSIKEYKFLADLYAQDSEPIPTILEIAAKQLNVNPAVVQVSVKILKFV